MKFEQKRNALSIEESLIEFKSKIGYWGIGRSFGQAPITESDNENTDIKEY